MAGSFLVLIGMRSAWRSFLEMGPETGGERLLVALHETAKAGFWLSLGAMLLGYALVEEPQGVRWFVLVPIGMAGLRLGAATLLSRR